MVNCDVSGTSRDDLMGESGGEDVLSMSNSRVIHIADCDGKRVAGIMGCSTKVSLYTHWTKIGAFPIEWLLLNSMARGNGVVASR